MTSASVEKILVDRAEAAQMLSVSKRTLDHLIALGQIRTVRIGRRVLVPRHCLERLVAARSVRTRELSRAVGQ